VRQPGGTYQGGKHEPPSGSKDPQPWRFFPTRLDFEIAKFMLDANMNRKQSVALLSLIKKCIQEPDNFNLSALIYGRPSGSKIEL